MAASDPAHDVMHMERVVANSRHLASREAARLEIVVPTAWLHDCVTLPKDSPQRAQAARLTAAEATRLLTNWGRLPDWLPAIAHAIEACRFSARIEPRTLEGKVVQDADTSRHSALWASPACSCWAALRGRRSPRPTIRSVNLDGWKKVGGPTFVFRGAEPEEG